MSKQQWKRLWKNELQETRIGGVWQRKKGGYLVRARAVDPTTGTLKEIRKVLPNATEAEAFTWLAERRSLVQAGGIKAPQSNVRFAEYAADLFEKKTAPGGSVRSKSGISRWKATLEHLVGGTYGETSKVFVKGFGDFFVERIEPGHVDAWRANIAQLIELGDYAPTTANGWLSILRVIMKAARRDLSLERLATDGVRDFDLSEHATYSEEEPNALPAHRVGDFLHALKDLYPQHYAMTFLGLVTGLRPSSLRPLRRSGPHADLIWNENRLLVRRSQTVGNEVMNTTKQKRRYSITLPDRVMEVLKWHIDTQLVTPEMQESDLLFPSTTGSFRAPTVLNKPFAEVADAIDLGFRFTQRGMRRTFNDLARAASVESIVTRSISGHLTERMQHHYSTVGSEEQKSSIEKLLGLFGRRSGS